MDSRYTKPLIITFVCFIVLIPSSLFVLKFLLQDNFKKEIEPKIVKTTTLTQLLSENHSGSKLFYAEIEFDPQKKATTLLETGYSNGYPFPLRDTPSSSSAKLFSYKLELISSENKLLQNGWVSESKEMILTPNKTYRFRITTLAEEKSLIKLSLPDNKLFWSYQQ